MPGGAPVPGYYGKLPGIGDFVSRRLPQQFIRPWDEWLQKVLSCSQEQLGADWLETYLTSPLWRFALSPGLLSEEGWIGVLMPSVDRVGRTFPFTIARPLERGFAPFELLDLADSWFERLDNVALSALDEDSDLETLDESLAGLGGWVAEGVAVGAWRGAQARSSKLAVRCQVASIANAGGVLPALATQAMRSLTSSHAVWWSQGSERVATSVLVTEGLPPVTGFAALLDGNWPGWGWDDSTATGPAPARKAG